MPPPGGRSEARGHAQLQDDGSGQPSHGPEETKDEQYGCPATSRGWTVRGAWEATAGASPHLAEHSRKTGEGQPAVGRHVIFTEH